MWKECIELWKGKGNERSPNCKNCHQITNFFSPTKLPCSPEKRERHLKWGWNFLDSKCVLGQAWQGWKVPLFHNNFSDNFLITALYLETMKILYIMSFVCAAEFAEKSSSDICQGLKRMDEQNLHVKFSNKNWIQIVLQSSSWFGPSLFVNLDLDLV